MESKEEERVRGESREEGDDRSGSLGSGRERVLSSREWMEPTELRGTALAGRGRTEALRSPFLSLSPSAGNRRARVSRACSRCCFASERGGGVGGVRERVRGRRGGLTEGQRLGWPSGTRGLEPDDSSCGTTSPDASAPIVRLIRFVFGGIGYEFSRSQEGGGEEGSFSKSCS